MDETNPIGLWRTPKPSRAKLKIIKKSSAHFVGQTTFGEGTGQGQCIQFGSITEYNGVLLLIYAPGVIDVEEQIEPVRYIGADGETHTRTFDFRVTKIGGSRSAIDVKYQKRSETYAYRDDVARAAAAAIPGTADKVFVVSKRNMDPARLQRVRLFHSCRFPQPEIDKTLWEYVNAFSGQAVLRDLLAAADLGDVGFHAAVRLIHRGILSVPEQVRITLSCTVAKGEVAT